MYCEIEPDKPQWQSDHYDCLLTGDGVSHERNQRKCNQNTEGNLPEADWRLKESSGSPNAKYRSLRYKHEENEILQPVEEMKADPSAIAVSILYGRQQV